MKVQSFNENWLFHLDGHTEKQQVTLPHDAMLHGVRAPKSPGKGANGFFMGGKYVYEKSFFAHDEWAEKHIMLAFGGVYRNTTIYLNGQKIGHRQSLMYTVLHPLCPFGCSTGQYRIIFAVLQPLR